MNVLVVGGGGREHAIVWKLARGGEQHRVYCAPGNAGTALVPGCTNIAADTIGELTAAAREREIDLAIVGPEQPLVDGLADHLREAGIACLGPSRSAAQLEGSKVAAKEFMTRQGIPTAAYEVTRSPEDARRAVSRMGMPVVLKADGLAAGKGVVVCRDSAEAETTIDAFMTERALGSAGETLVVEECLEGYEATILVFTDGRSAYELPPSKDHKPIGEGNTGPNTGGMGVLCPHPEFDARKQETFRTDILEPTLGGMRSEGLDYRGVLYFGLMVTAGGLSVLEYNVRLGDPEAQAVLPVIDTDFAGLCLATATGRLSEVPPLRSELSSCVVVAASGGYPRDYRTGYRIHGLEACESPVFMAGVGAREDALVTAGGRVLSVCGLGRDPDEARAAAYRDMGRISFDGMYYRRDIGGTAPRVST